MSDDSSEMLLNTRRPSYASPEQKQNELDRLLRSGIVREGTQLYNLLSYLGKKSLGYSTEPLKEYTIGVEALGKPADYDPRVDPTVRVEVGRLRRKLREHYQDSTEDRPVKLLIPKGGYLPSFVFDSASHIPVAVREERLPWRLLTGAGVVILALTVTIVFLLFWGTGTTPLDADVAKFWAPHLGNSKRTLIVYGTPLFVKIGGSYFRDPQLNRGDQLEQDEDLQAILKALKPQEVRPLYNFTGMGEASALFLLTRLLTSQGVPLSVQRSDTLTWEDLKDQHVIFLGGRKFNPQLPELPVKPKYETFAQGVQNLRPQKGEPLEYKAIRGSPHGELKQGYALISVYPGLTPHTRIVVLDCSSSEGTLAAAEFVTRPDTLHDFYAGQASAPSKGETSQGFQIVVGARFNNGIVVKLFDVTHSFLK